MRSDERFAGLLGWASWLSLWLALLAAVTALFSHWAVDGLGTRDMGVALFFAFLAALLGIGTLYAAPALALAGLLAFLYQRHAGLRFLAAGAICGIPLAVLTLLER
jgi:hypothetical protein